jgi:hypothetical protein
MRKPVVCVGTQAMMNMKCEQFDTALLAGGCGKMQQYRRVKTATESECDAKCDTVRNNNARQNVFQRALKYRIQFGCGIIQRRRFP